MRPLEALPTITTTAELEGYLEQGRAMSVVYTVEEQQAIARRKVEILRGV